MIIDRIPQFLRTIQLCDQAIDRVPVIDRYIGLLILFNVDLPLGSISAGGCVGADSFCNESFLCVFGTDNTTHHTKHSCQGFTALLLRGMHIKVLD